MPSFFEGFAKGFLRQGNENMEERGRLRAKYDERAQERLDKKEYEKDVLKARMEIELESKQREAELEKKRVAEELTGAFGKEINAAKATEVQGPQEGQIPSMEFSGSPNAATTNNIGVDGALVDDTIPDVTIDDIALPAQPGVAKSAVEITEAANPDHIVKPNHGYTDDELELISMVNPQTMDQLEKLKLKIAENRLKAAETNTKLDAKHASTSKLKETNRKLAAEVGVPFKEINPIWDATDEERGKYERDDKSKTINHKDTQAAIKQASQNVVDADRLMSLQGKLTTGPIVRPFGTTWTNADAKTFDAIVKKLTPQQRVPGSGSSSDLDVKMFESALPSLSNKKETNEFLIKGLKLDAQRQLDYHNFRNTYFEVNRTTEGADPAWQEYVDANPVFQEDKSGVELDGKKYKPKKPVSWKEYFKKQSGLAAPETPTNNEAPDISGLSDEEIKKQLGI